MSQQYSELDELNGAFMGALRADPKPQSNAALLWHEAIDVDRKVSPPRVRSRGDAFLLYLRDHASLDQVPGQNFAPNKLPHVVCTRLMTEHAPLPDGPRFIAFRYDRGPEGLWSGGCRIETQKQYQDLVAGRKPYDDKLTEALRGRFAPGVVSIGLTYGLRRWEQPGPQLRVDTGELAWSEPDGEVKAAWDEWVAYLKNQGMRHLYSAELRLDKPKARLREDNIKLRYSV
jgi:hypothetical protein